MRESTTGLEQVTLPIMPGTARKLTRVLAHSNSLNADVQQILLTDPAAAIALFRRLGKVRPDARDSLTHAAHAVSMLGREQFKKLVAELPTLDPGPPDDRPRRAFAYSQSAHAAFYADAVSTMQGQPGNPEMPTAALLQQPAVIALWARDPESAARATNAARDQVPYEQAFSAELGRPLSEINLQLAAAWSFPNAARATLNAAGAFNHRLETVRLADRLAQSTALDWNSEDTVAAIEMLADHTRMEPDAAATWLRQQAKNAAQLLSNRAYPLPGFELLFLPREEEPDIDHPIPEFGRRPRRPPTPPSVTATAAAADLHSMLSETLHELQSAARLRRVLFLMLSRDRTRLQVRLAAGCGAVDPLRKLSLPMVQKHLFSLLMGKPQSLWFSNATRAKYLPLLPLPLHGQLAEKGFYAMSLWGKGRPIGLFLADGDELDSASYTTFRQHCQRANNLLTGTARAA